jgi:hypothetical protein
MVLESLDPVRKMEQGLNPIKWDAFSNGVESQNMEFKSNLQGALHWRKARLERNEAGKYQMKFFSIDDTAIIERRERGNDAN